MKDPFETLDVSQAPDELLGRLPKKQQRGLSLSLRERGAKELFAAALVTNREGEPFESGCLAVTATELLGYAVADLKGAAKSGRGVDPVWWTSHSDIAELRIFGTRLEVRTESTMDAYFSLMFQDVATQFFRILRDSAGLEPPPPTPNANKEAVGPEPPPPRADLRMVEPHPLEALSEQAIWLPAIVAAPVPQVGLAEYEPVFAFFDPLGGAAVTEAIPHKKLKNWRMGEPRMSWPMRSVMGVEVDIAGRRITHGGLTGFAAGLATLGWSYYATTKAHDQTWISLSLRGGLTVTLLTEAIHATVLDGMLSPFRSAIAHERQSDELGDFSGQIRRLAELRDEGLISEEEFESKKRQILGLD